MADVPTVQILHNGYRNVVLNVTLISDGSGVTDYKIFDATSATFAVNRAGQLFLPGVHTKVVGMSFDVQDMKYTLAWEATANIPFLAYGASPEDFDWKPIGGLYPPQTAPGLTGSILLSTLNPMPNATLSFQLNLRKGVPNS